jgi:hypothetical protein
MIIRFQCFILIICLYFIATLPVVSEQIDLFQGILILNNRHKAEEAIEKEEYAKAMDYYDRYLSEIKKSHESSYYFRAFDIAENLFMNNLYHHSLRYYKISTGKKPVSVARYRALCRNYLMLDRTDQVTSCYAELQLRMQQELPALYKPEKIEGYRKEDAEEVKDQQRLNF